jgi:hypothetical protein
MLCRKKFNVFTEFLQIFHYICKVLSSQMKYCAFIISVQPYSKMSLKINIVDPATIKQRQYQDEKPLPSMEAVHHPDDRPWIGEKINLNRHFSRFSELVASSRCTGLMKADVKSNVRTTNRKLKQLMESTSGETISDSMFNEIVENCDIKNFTIHREMEPQQQFTEINAQFSKFVPGTAQNIPSMGTRNLDTLKFQQEFLDKASDYERYKRMRGLRNPNNAHFEAAPPPPTRLCLDLLDKEVRFRCYLIEPVLKFLRNCDFTFS